MRRKCFVTIIEARIIERKSACDASASVYKARRSTQNAAEANFA